MLISLSRSSRKFIFIANTKTASTSIESLLQNYAQINIIRPPNLKHMPYSMLVKRFDFLFSCNHNYRLQNFYKFGVFRDPVDWLISWFNYRSRSEISNTNHPMYKNYVGNTSFEDFVIFLEQKKFLRPQKYKFIDKRGNNAMDFLIDYQNLEADLKYVLKTLRIKNIEVKLPYANKSSHIRIKREDVQEYTIAKIKDFFQEDYEFFDRARKKQSMLV